MARDEGPVVSWFHLGRRVSSILQFYLDVSEIIILMTCSAVNVWTGAAAVKCS